jgi:hypothetical protein
MEIMQSQLGHDEVHAYQHYHGHDEEYYHQDDYHKHYKKHYEHDKIRH